MDDLTFPSGGVSCEIDEEMMSKALTSDIIAESGGHTHLEMMMDMALTWQAVSLHDDQGRCWRSGDGETWRSGEMTFQRDNFYHAH